MSFADSFDSDLGNYTPHATSPALAQWVNVGNPSPGCANLYGGFTSPDYYSADIDNNGVDTHLVAAGEDLYFNARFVAEGIAGPFNPLTNVFQVFVGFSDATSLFFTYPGESLIPSDVFPDGLWLQFNFDLSTREGKTINRIYFLLTASAGNNWPDGLYVTAWIDSVEFATSPPPFDPDPGGSNELRYMGLAADQVNLYATANDDGTLKLLAYNLESLAQVTEASFGAATYAELDARTRGIFPVVKPGNDGVLFARGRDGNNKQVLLSDDYGATFTDASDGGWATSKYCVGLLPDPLRPDDLVAVFDDNDLYQSQDGSVTWAKTGDAPATLRAAARHLTSPEELLLGAQAEDTLYWAPNLGASFEDVSDAALGTINAIEVSR